MNRKVVKYGRNRVRKDYSDIKVALKLPYLVEIQTGSYDWFVKEGLKEILHDVSPIKDHSETLALEFLDYEFDEPTYSIEEARRRAMTFSAPLKVRTRLHNSKTGEVNEQSVYMGDFPKMSESGTFVINGAERIIVSQLVRSSGVYYSKSTDKKSGNEKFAGQVIPTRGAWLEFEMDSKDILYARVDRTRKIPLTTFLRALGISRDDEMLKLFGNSDMYLLNTFAKDTTGDSDEAILEVYEKLRPGEPAVVENARHLFEQRFFDNKKYDLAKVGRYKFDKKLHIKDRAIGMKLAEDIFNLDTGEVLLEKGMILEESHFEVLEKNTNNSTVKEIELDCPFEDEKTFVQMIKVLNENVELEETEKIYNVIGNYNTNDCRRVTTSDMIASIGYYLNVLNGLGTLDDIDHLGNRRVRLVGELLQNQFRIGLARLEKNIRDKMSIQETEKLTPMSLINIRPITATIKEFFGSSQLSQFMDQTNPLTELTHKRRLSALGPGGLTRDRAGLEVRDVHFSHYGRMCPIETPEGPNIGLINYLSSYAKVNEFGFIETPYRKVDKKKKVVLNDIEYLSADEERQYVVGQASITLGENGEMLDEELVARHGGENILVKPEEVDFVDVSPQQIVSVATACIPFLEHDDANRALMGANMQRQAIPLLVAEAPIVATGMEYVAAKDSGAPNLSKVDGVVSYVDSNRIEVQKDDGDVVVHNMIKFERSNQGTMLNHRPIISLGEKIEKGDIIADGPSMDQGELSLGRNVTVAFMTWNGYNYEDAIIISERLVKDDVYTSVHIGEHAVEARDTKLGPEQITREIPNVGDSALKNLDEDGIIRIGAEVKAGDILVGKVTAKVQAELSAEEKLLHAIFGEKVREVRDTSLRVPHGANGIVHDVRHFSRKNGDELPAGVNEVIKVFIVQKRKIRAGDKMAGRHGNKGVISKVLPEEDMPYLPDGTPVDIMLNPLGVPSRMNVGQLLEVHLGIAARSLDTHIVTPVFDGATENDVLNLMKEAGMADDGKTVLYDGRTGEPFDNRITVGVMYMLKLAHMVDDKLHARSTGPYSLVTQQPLGGKAQFGGQRFGEMEVWALEAYGAAHALQEVLTVKSDDIIGRVKVYEAIVRGEKIPKSGVPESFRVLIKELQALGMDINILTSEEERVEMNNDLQTDIVEGDELFSGVFEEEQQEFHNQGLSADTMLEEIVTLDEIMEIERDNFED